VVCVPRRAGEPCRVEERIRVCDREEDAEDDEEAASSVDTETVTCLGRSDGLTEELGAVVACGCSMLERTSGSDEA